MRQELWKTERRPDETAMGHAMRMIEDMGAWSAAHSAECRSIGETARKLACHEGQEVADAYFRAANLSLYRRFPEC